MFLSPCNSWIKTNTKYDTQLVNWMTPGSIIDHGLCLLEITLLIEMVRWTPSGYFYFLSYFWHLGTWLLLYWSKLLLSFVNVLKCILALVLMTCSKLATATLLLLLLGSLRTFSKVSFMYLSNVKEDLLWYLWHCATWQSSHTENLLAVLHRLPSSR